MNNSSSNPQTSTLAVTPLAYESVTNHPPASAARALGLAIAVVAAIRLVMFVPSAIIWSHQVNSLPVSDRSAYSAVYWLSAILTLALSVLAGIGGILAFRLRRCAVGLLMGWAWVTLLYCISFFTYAIWFAMHLSNIGRMPTSSLVYNMAWDLERWGMATVLPIITLILFRSRAFTAAFEHAAIAI